MSGFSSASDGEFDRVYMTETDLVDRFVGEQLWGWGNNNQGPIGNNTVSTKYSNPVQTIAGGTNWKQVTTNGLTSFGIKTDGTLWSCGYGGNGIQGNNNTVAFSSPVPSITGATNWKQISYQRAIVLAVKTDGTLWSWGNGVYGQIGNNTTLNYSSPIQPIAGTTNWKQVAVGYHHAAAIKTDGTLWAWGHNGYGSIGDNTTAAKSSPVSLQYGSNWKQVACGYGTTAGIKSNGELWIWGGYFQNRGLAGNNTTSNYSSPVTPAGGGTWKQVACGNYNTMAGIKTDGTLWMWGTNSLGQLGTNNTSNYSSPVQTIAGGTNWKQVSCSGYFTAAIKTDGTLWTWGDDSYGQLGQNNTSNYSSPVSVLTNISWKQVSVDFNTVLAIGY